MEKEINYSSLLSMARDEGKTIDEVFNDLVESGEKFILGYIKDAEFTSVWDGYEVTTNCKVNTITKQIFDIDKVDSAIDDDGDELEVLDVEFVVVDGEKYLAGHVDDDTPNWEPGRDYWYR